MKFVITVDTEADNQWSRGQPVSTENIASIPRFQEMCDRFGFRPTYLCSYGMVADDRFTSGPAAWQQAGRAEVGAHLHPWSNPPFEADPFHGTDAHAYPTELPLDVFRAKMADLTQLIRVRCGRPPVSYRAGRWGLNAEHVPVLIDLGYQVDCSVTPNLSWAKFPGAKQGGPDFTGAPLFPYFLDPDDVCRAGGSDLLEVPMTVLHTSRLAVSDTVRRLYGGLRGTLPGRIANKVFRLEPQWFRPYPHMSVERLKAVYRAARRRGLPLVEMMFHSSELMPGGSPYNPTEESTEALYAKFQGLFEFLEWENCLGTTLSELRDEFAQREQVRTDAV